MTDFSNTPIVDLAAIIAEHLQLQGIEVVLVGGLAVEIYTENLYLTSDIDMVNTNYQSTKLLSHAMSLLDFHKQGRVFVNSTTPIVVEFPAAPLAIGDELVKKTTFKFIGDKRIPILSVRDVAKDRLAAYMHWQDNQSLIQAITIMLKHQLTPDMFQEFCEREGDAVKFQLLDDFFIQAKKQSNLTMKELEPVLTRLLVKQL